MVPERGLHHLQVGTGPPLLLIHGGLSNGRLAWHRTVDALKDVHTLIVPDRRGHGRSPREPRPYTISGDAQDVLELADRLALRRFHLVGHSYGGIVALHIAGRVPERVASLHLIEPPLLALLPEDPDIAELACQTERLWRSAGTQSTAQTAEEFLTMVAGAEFVEKIKVRSVWHELVAEAERLQHEEDPREYMPPFLDQLGETHPVVVYSGGRSHPALRKVAHSLAQRVPEATLIQFDEAYHEVHKIGAPFERTLLHYTRGFA